MNDNIKHISWKYRALFYSGGFAFAVISYFAVIWAFLTESTGVGGVSAYYTLIKSLTERLDMHIASFMIWNAVCVGAFGAIGHLFDKEVYYRKRAEQQANVDGLTGVYNHRFFQERLQNEIERASRYNRALSLIIVDLDDFKAFNDTWGHQEGDKILIWFSELCGKIIRNIDVLARYGGEEFAIILPETTSRAAKTLAERLRKAVEKDSRNISGKERTLTVSAGVASFPIHGETRHSLVLNADVALYYAKQMGKNRVCVFSEDSGGQASDVAKHTVPALEIGDDAIEALGDAIDSRDGKLAGHSRAVMRMAVALGERMGLTAEEINSLRAAALLHDLGSVGIPETVLHKPGPLTLEEWQMVKSHVEIGASLVKRMQQLVSIIPGIKHHHERFDGHGYPSGLSGENIPILARIIAITESYDAMVKPRPYREALSSDDAKDELKRCAGTQFDPELVKVFLALLDETTIEAA